MRLLGPGARLHTDGARQRPHGGTASGTATCTCAAAATPRSATATFNRIWEFGYGPTAAQLVQQLAAHGITRVTGQMFADESLFDRNRGGLMTNLSPTCPTSAGSSAR